MSDTAIGIGCLFFAVLGLLYCPHWFKNGYGKEKFIAIFCLIMSLFVLAISVFLITYDNSLLWFGQHKKNSVIEMDINSEKVEETSFLYFIDNFNSKTTKSDVISFMGEDYKETKDSRLSIEYSSPKYTLMGLDPSFITFTFNKQGTKILSVTWGVRISDQGLLQEFFNYLSQYALGKPKKVGVHTADWTGLHLEETSSYILFERNF